MNKYTGKINGHPVEFEWDVKKKDVLAVDKYDLNRFPLVEWITDIKPVEPEVDWSKLTKQPDCEVRDGDNECWRLAIFVRKNENTDFPYRAATLYGHGSTTAWKQCRPLNPEPVVEKEPVKPKLKFPAPPEGREWQNPDNLTPEQVEVDKGWRLKLKGETWDSPQTINMLQEWDSRNSAWSKLNIPLQGWVDCSTYRTKHKLPVVEKEEVELECWSNLYTNGFTGFNHKSLAYAKLSTRKAFLATYHIRKVKGKDATIKKVEG